MLTGQSLWPVQMCITSLPPQIRMNVDYLLLGGIWLGLVKPDMKLILEPVLKKIEQLDIIINVSGGVKHLKAKLLIGVFDLPAKAMATNFIQFNGKHGCTYCTDEGTYFSHRRIYLPNDNHTSRKTHEVTRCARRAEREGITVCGIKGFSILSPYISIPKSVPIDYMHAVLEGVTKSLIRFWFDSTNHGTRFYLGTQVGDINRALLRIKPPHEFRRTPRSVTTSKYWKASEFRAWLLFYSIPVLSDFLPLDYLEHLSLLVSSMHILLSTSISKPHLEVAHLMLVRFYELIPVLYPQTLCTMNSHSLIHLCECVQRWGPLWCFSTFGFENLNGYMKKHCHGTRNVLPQLINNITMRQTLPLLQKKLKPKESAATIDFLGKVSETHNKDKQGALGKVVHQKLTTEEIKVLKDSGFQVTQSVPVFFRYKEKGVIFASSRPHNSRDSSACQVSIGASGETCFGSILRFCFVDKIPVAIISIFQHTGQDIHKEPCSRSSLQADDHRAAKFINIFMSKVKKLSLSKRIVVVTPDSILRKCIHIPIKHSSTDYIVTLPNSIEKH